MRSAIAVGGILLHSGIRAMETSYGCDLFYVALAEGTRRAQYTPSHIDIYPCDVRGIEIAI